MTATLPRGPKRVAIVAMGASHHLFSHQCVSLGGMIDVDEVWGINAVGGPFNCDRLFMIDDLRYMKRLAEQRYHLGYILANLGPVKPLYDTGNRSKINEVCPPLADDVNFNFYAGLMNDGAVIEGEYAKPQPDIALIETKIENILAALEENAALHAEVKKHLKINDVGWERRCREYSSYVTWLPKYKGILYTSHPYPEYPTSVEFPLQEVLNHFGDPYLYMNTTVAFALAFAIASGVEEIYLYGCDFSYPDRHAAESGRGCAEYWVGRARERGIRIRVAETSTLMDMDVPLQKKLYGYHVNMHIDCDIDSNGKATFKVEKKDAS